MYIVYYNARLDFFYLWLKYVNQYQVTIIDVSKMTKKLLLATVMLVILYLKETKQLKPNRFGTKTAYQHEYNASDSSLNPPANCYPVHLNMVIRHGSRYPSDGDREDIDKLLTKLNEIHTISSPLRYQNLTIPWNKPPEWGNAEPSELSVVGEIEQYNIAKRFRSRFTQVFIKQYWNKYYKFISSDKLRTAQSAMSFSFGLFEAQGPVASSNFQPVAIAFSGHEDNDKLLSSYDSCPRYEVDVKEHGMAEVEKFNEGSEIRNLTKRLQQKLQVKGKLSLNFDFVEKIFRLCAFGIMNRGDNSWCALLDEEDVKIMEYQGDLEAYYEHSYGNELSYKIVCPLLSEITQNLQDLSRGKSDVRGVFRFASSGTLVSLLTIFGLFKDSAPLRANNYLQQSRRHFRMSNMVPMSANIALVVFECNSTENAGKRKHMVQLLVNEKPVSLPCCYGNTTCTLDKFVSCYEEAVKSCDFDAMCSLPPTGKPKALGAIFSPRLEVMLIAIVSSLLVKNV